MIPPIPFEAHHIRYTLDALLARVSDLDRLQGLLGQALAAGSSTSLLTYDPERLAQRTVLEHIVTDIAQVAADLNGVIATIEPNEWARSTIATGAPWPIVQTVSQWLYAETSHHGAVPHETPVVECRTIEGVTPPATLSDRFDRIPTGDSHIRIDHFQTEAGPRFEVYLAGTDFSAGPPNPWWVGANAELWETGQSRSLSAAETALRDAGVTATTPIVLTGHSQGGAIAVALANSGRYRVDAVFTAGMPAGLVQSNSEIPTVHVVHPEDPVPSLGGRIDGSNGTTWVVHSEPRVTGSDAHVADEYRRTMRRIDHLNPVDVDVDGGLSGIAQWYRTTSG